MKRLLAFGGLSDDPHGGLAGILIYCWDGQANYRCAVVLMLAMYAKVAVYPLQLGDGGL